MFSLWYSQFLLLLLAYTGSLSSAELLVGADGSRSLQDKNIFILAGQSNMAGRGGVVNDVWDGVIPAECEPNQSIIRFNSHRKWVEAQEPLHVDIDFNKTCGVGPGMAFANTLLQMDSSNIGVIGFVPCAVGGTNISEWSQGAPLYNLFIRRSKKSLLEGGRIRAVLWYQGESDTVHQKDAESYGHNLKKFISNVRQDLHLPMLPFIQVALASGEGPFVGIVRKAQLEIDLPNVWTIDADGLPVGPDGLHLTTEAQVRLGQMLAEAFFTRTVQQRRPISSHASKRNR
ncbi:probable carbohydrate esterase At4g34215 [Papaver somniferum]|uniref:probable carbohydrate esterase At4g34215 n=1 Tax=Papaver somniferum TaxID=3469 RepID=UPI000E703269|nr:probable carbohydrate esterase At4g34215 [Papaver somniferum]